MVSKSRLLGTKVLHKWSSHPWHIRVPTASTAQPRAHLPRASHSAFPNQSHPRWHAPSPAQIRTSPCLSLCEVRTILATVHPSPHAPAVCSTSSILCVEKSFTHLVPEVNHKLLQEKLELFFLYVAHNHSPWGYLRDVEETRSEGSFERKWLSSCWPKRERKRCCLLYTSDAADEERLV